MSQEEKKNKINVLLLRRFKEQVYSFGSRSGKIIKFKKKKKDVILKPERESVKVINYLIKIL